MGVGSHLRRLRVEAHRTQRSVASGAGVAAEYLSRLENDRVTPTTRTLAKIAESLSVPISAFFDGPPHLEAGDQCPVSASGRCILDHLHAGRSAVQTQRAERYSRDQLEALRTCDFLIHSGSPEVQHTLVMVLRSLIALNETTQTAAQAG